MITQANADLVIEVTNLKIYIGGAWVHNGLNFDARRGEILAIVGGSGAGKSLLLRQMLALQQPTSGEIKIFGHSLHNISPIELDKIRKRCGVLFQHSALFSSLTVLENVAFPLNENTSLDPSTIKELALLKIIAAGLPENAANKYPAELSGGMEKRAALARAIVLDPELLFLDEPTSGLDPHAAASFDELVLSLKSTLGLTIVMVTHDLDSLWHVTDRVAFLGDGKVLCLAPLRELVQSKNPLIQAYFKGPRGRVTSEIYGTQS